jgi:pimeloyl-ACP methyl ester carboxylesterase
MLEGEDRRAARRRVFYTAALVLLVLIAACSRGERPGRAAGGRPSPTGGTVTAAPATPAPAGATAAGTAAPTPAAGTGATPVARSEPRFEPGACPFRLPSGQVEGRTVTCGTVTVPEDRERPGGPVVRLAVAVFKARATAPRPEPLIWLDGGPGGPSLDNIGTVMTGSIAQSLLAERDVVLFDQRGTGYSRPSLACPELYAVKRALFTVRLSLAEQEARNVAAARACHDRLVREGVNLAAYTSAASAADVNDLRRALGYDKVNLYGVSYGTRLALTVLRDFPDIVRAAVLDSAVPLQINLYSDVAASAERAFRTLFDGCAADRACRAAFPTLEDDFYALVARLNRDPVTIALRQTLLGRSQDYLLTGDRLIAGVFQALYYTNIIPSLPRAIRRAADGSYDLLATLLGPILLDESIAWGLYFSVQCGEEVPFASLADIAAAERAVRPEIRDGLRDGSDDGGVEAFYTSCALWGVRTAAPVENEPVTSAVPVLVLSGQYDPITPPAYAELAARTLTHAFVFTFPGVGHGVFLGGLFVGGCSMRIMEAFLRDPAARPDATCIAAMRGPNWNTSR